MPLLVTLCDRVSVLLAMIAAALLAVAAAIVTWMVFYRALGNSAYWEIEFAVYLMVGTVFLAAPYGAMTKGHVGVDLLTEFTPPGAARAIAFTTAVISAAVCLYLAAIGWELTVHAVRSGETGESMWRPVKWPLYAAMPLGMGFTCLQYLAEAAKIAGGRAR